MSLRGRLGIGAGLLGCCALAVGQTAAPAGDAKPKADLIFVHANVYTGVPDDTPFSSVLRAEAIAVKGDRILAVGKTFDLQKFKGDQT